MTTHDNDTCPSCRARLAITGTPAAWYLCPKCKTPIVVTGVVTSPDGARVFTFDRKEG